MLNFGEVGPRGRDALFGGLLRRGLFAGCNPMCNPMCSRLQPYVQPCNPMRSRLQPYVQQTATLCAAGCNPVCSRLQPYVQEVRPLRRCAQTLTFTLTRGLTRGTLPS